MAEISAEPSGTPPVAATQSEVPAPEAQQTEIAAPAEPSQPEVAAPVEPAQPEVAGPVAPAQAEVAASDLVGDDPAPAKKASAKRTAGRSTAKKAAAESAPDDEAAATTASKRAPRKRAAKKVPEPVEVAAEAPTAAAAPAGWVAPTGQPQPTGQPEAAAAAAPETDAPTAVEAETSPTGQPEADTPTAPDTDIFNAADSDTSPAAPDADTSLAAPAGSAVTPTGALAETSAPDPVVAEPIGPEPEAATDEPTLFAAAAEGDAPTTPPAPDYSWLADPFAVPAVAQPEDEDIETPVEEADDTTEDDEEPEEGSRRRRRRRGGRRRRRGGGDEDAADQDGEPDADADPQQVASAPVAEPPAEAAEASEEREDGEDADGEDPEGQRRRRRRRRRRGEETAALPDDPTDVVVRVREPRTRKRAASTEVTGIEGSTRMEAKRQRRREGRDAGRRRAPILSEAEFLARRESVLRQMIIRQGPDLAQIAVLEDGILVEHYVDRDSAASLIGNVYLGRVQNVLPSMEAAFVDIGRGRNAVLYAGEVDWDSFGADGHNRKVEKVLKSGQMVLVQVSKDPVGAKGARLTNHVSIPGRYVVYAPGGHLSGISRKLPDSERRRLKDILADLVGESASVIVRTAAEGASEDELVRDVNRLKAQWADIEKKVKAGNSPQLLYGEPDLTVRIVRDLFTEDFSELIIQGNATLTDAYDAIIGYVSHVAPHLQERIRRWEPTGEGDLFDEYRLDEQIAKALERKVFLPSGGSLVIDRTEAMTVIDVNTGKFTGTGGNLEATVTSNNLEAAEEIVRQLRLRDIGGIIVIDFIDMVLPNNRELLLRRLVECLGRDRTRHQVAEVTSLGLVQMTRKKIGTGLLEAFGAECAHCHGRGYELNDQPVDSQQQADGGTREQRGRDRGRGQDNGRNGSSRTGSPRGEDAAASPAHPLAAGDGEAESGGRSTQSGGRSRGGRRSRGGSAERESSSEATESVAEPEPVASD